MTSDQGALSRRLRSAGFEIVGAFVDASNATLLARFTDRDPRSLDDLAHELGRPLRPGDLEPDDLAVVKPRGGEAPLWDFPGGSLHRREVAAFLVSDALGWDLVPQTVLFDHPDLGSSSVQRYVPHDPRWHYFTLLEAGVASVLTTLRAMAVFDVVVQNADRKAGHVLLEDVVDDGGGRRHAARPTIDDVEPAGIVRLIDHGVTFSTEPKLRTVAWDFAGERIPAVLLADLDALGESLTGDLGARLAQLIDADEVDVLASRVADILEDPRFPYPHGARPYPWPLL